MTPLLGLPFGFDMHTRMFAWALERTAAQTKQPQKQKFRMADDHAESDICSGGERESALMR
ncbi:hypothetical protein QCE63_06515 [Caballeronia sp. LZ065]|nr:hypothetical protein [Caballeronia sp. LZ065]